MNEMNLRNPDEGTNFLITSTLALIKISVIAGRIDFQRSNVLKLYVQITSVH
jgi:hypothetical protein